jgi:hypothetical protein
MLGRNLRVLRAARHRVEERHDMPVVLAGFAPNPRLAVAGCANARAPEIQEVRRELGVSARFPARRELHEAAAVVVADLRRHPRRAEHRSRETARASQTLLVLLAEDRAGAAG